MKKILAIALCALMTLSVLACTASPAAPAADAPQKEATAAPVEQPTEEPTPEPIEEPTPEPTEEPTPEPTQKPLEAADLYGIWSLDRIDYGGSILAPSDLGMEMYLEFREDGSMRELQASYGSVEETFDTYAVGDNAILIGTGDDSGELVYDAENHTVALELEEDGKQIRMIFAYTPDAVLPEVTSEGVIAKEDLVGTWNTVGATLGELTLTAEQLGDSGVLTLIFREDGMVQVGSKQSEGGAVPYRITETAIEMYDGETVLYEAIYNAEDGTLRLLEPNSGVTFIFEKEN